MSKDGQMQVAYFRGFFARRAAAFEVNENANRQLQASQDWLGCANEQSNVIVHIQQYTQVSTLTVFCVCITFKCLVNSASFENKQWMKTHHSASFIYLFLMCDKALRDAALIS